MFMDGLPIYIMTFGAGHNAVDYLFSVGAMICQRVVRYVSLESSNAVNARVAWPIFGLLPVTFCCMRLGAVSTDSFCALDPAVKVAIAACALVNIEEVFKLSFSEMNPDPSVFNDYLPDFIINFNHHKVLACTLICDGPRWMHTYESDMTKAYTII